MKNIFTTLIILSIFSSALIAQSLSIVEKSSDSISADYFTEMVGQVTIKNTASVNNTYLVERFELDMTPGHTSYFCWSIDCYSTDVSLSTSNIELAPNQEDSTFGGYLTPYDNNGGIAGTSTVKYRFFNQNNLSDTVSVVFVYTASPVSGITTKILNQNEFHIYPNPAVNTLNVVFGDLGEVNSGRIIIRNALGSELINTPLELGNNLSRVDISELERGVYFYTVQLDGKNYQTKKFAVSK